MRAGRRCCRPRPSTSAVWTHSPLVAVIERDGDQVRLVGAITAARLMGQLIGGS
jgi:hypothetical protein